MKHTLGVFAVAAALAFAGGVASTSANAASSNGTKATSDKQAVSDTDISSHRRHWRYGHVRPWPGVYPYSYSYYRPRPYYYRPYSYGYYPSAYYHRPYYYRPAPVFSIGIGFGPSFGFGPRHYW